MVICLREMVLSSMAMEPAGDVFSQGEWWCSQLLAPTSIVCPAKQVPFTWAQPQLLACVLIVSGCDAPFAAIHEVCGLYRTAKDIAVVFEEPHVERKGVGSVLDAINGHPTGFTPSERRNRTQEKRGVDGCCQLTLL